MSRSAALLDAARRLVSPGGIQIEKQGTRRPPRNVEALALILGALASASRWTGVKTLNITNDAGAPVALALIEGARFGEDSRGHTTLSAVIDHEEAHPDPHLLADADRMQPV